MNGDIIGYEIVSQIINDRLTQVIKVITWFGSAVCLITIAILLLVFLKKKRLALFSVVNLFVITIINQALKHLLQRERPTEYRIITETGYSFTSNYSMISMAYYGFLIYKC